MVKITEGYFPMRQKKLHKFFGSLVLATLVVIAGCGGETAQLVKGEPAPAFALSPLKSGTLTFPDDLQGNVVAIRFWADWCPFCATEMRDIEPLYQKYRDQGLTILAVNVRQEREVAEKFISKLNISYDVLLDEEGTVARRYGVMGLPTTFFVDRNGKLGAKVLGESTPEVFERIIEELL